MTLYGGIDLHANSNVVVFQDEWEKAAGDLFHSK